MSLFRECGVGVWRCVCGVLSVGVELCVCGVERSFARSAAVWRHVSPPIADLSFIKSFLNKLVLMC